MKFIAKFCIFTVHKKLPFSGLLFLRPLVHVDGAGRRLHPTLRVPVHWPRKNHLQSRRPEKASTNRGP